ncbi:hypothetical protein TRV_00494 [Trichophyton verrucosum HKI 0517]|uniref:DASH complex subunit DAM1 n=1 Tax=Trichophyton verrucosum (strain HKI 0517) TaxID=663202 RepID=D4D099_TRIVH|nr:uncharacterized protein TRV_00494 [Trichophyton verrucosum HKI 0517]EFE44703.1 hypothetical protein TRV_00494 [Trichophyton verrucosum HKI 0517]
MADLEENFVHLQLMHESLSRFNESFASFLYGLNMNAFCVDFPESIPDAVSNQHRYRHLSQNHSHVSSKGKKQERKRMVWSIFHIITYLTIALGEIFTDRFLELQAASEQQYQSGANDAETTFMCVA